MNLIDVNNRYLDYPKIQIMSDIDALTYADANEKKTPLVLTDVMSKWPSYPKWNFNYFATEFGKHKISADRIDKDNKKEYIYLDIAEFIDYSITTKDENPFYAISNFHLSNNLQTEYSLPKYFHCWYREYQSESPNLNLSSLYLGPPGVRSLLHRDIWGTSFWNALFEGKKLWLFYSEEQSDYLYDGCVNPFDPDFEKYPLFEKAIGSMWIQEAGQLIFSPGNVWHAILTLEPCLALSENFINASNYKNVLGHFKKHNHSRAYNKMKKIAALHDA